MSTITHFYALAALDYVQGPPAAPWKQWFANSYYGAAGIAQPGTADPLAEINNASTIWGKIIVDYVLALHNRRIAHEAAARLCGGLPHARNWVPGGVTKAPDTTDCADIRSKLEGVRDFILKNYIPLALIVTWLYSGYDNVAMQSPGASGTPNPTGVGAGWVNFLSYGAFNERTGVNGAAETSSKRVILRGTAVNGAVTLAPSGDPTTWVSKITEHVDNSWYAGPDNLAPASGVTDPQKPKGAAYSWLKAPRYDGRPMEVGPLARLWVSGLYKWGVTYPGLNTLVHTSIGLSAALLGANPTVICGASVMDRHRARAVEALVIINRILGYSALNLNPSPTSHDGYPGWLDLIDPASADVGGAIVGNKSMPAENATGYGLNEAPRGALGHWLTVGSAGRIKNYQCVVPTTWNGSPTTPDTAQQEGPIEKALMGTNISGALSSGQLVPVEALRVVHSFDPCIACAVHVVEASGKKLEKIL